MPKSVTEDTIEYAMIEWLQSIGYDYIHGGTIAPSEPAAERDSYNDVLLVGRLRQSLEIINKHIPRAARRGAVDEVVRKIQKTEGQNPVINNRTFHRLLTEGVDVSYRDKDQIKHDKVWLVDFDTPLNNAFLAVNQYTVTDVNPKSRAKTNRRPDIVLFVNGLPLVVIELKNPADEKATIHAAYNQLQTYKDDIASLFTFNGLIAISDGTLARLGSLTAGWEWFKPWRTVDGVTLDPHPTELETLVRGVFAPEHLLDIIRYFVVFEGDRTPKKKVAAYHQYHAVNRAVERTVSTVHADGDQKIGVVWHTQGSGKSLSMLFYAGKVTQRPEMQNPTLIILTDRNDLDDQLFGVFAGGRDLLYQDPVQATSRDHLRDLLAVASGGVVFTTIQKFEPPEGESVYTTLSERHNIIFIADEAHRSQYGFSAKINRDDGDIRYGFAKYVRDALPNASFIGFTGTPIEKTDANTRQVFGDYIDIYDIQRAVDDGATVPIYYEARLARLHLEEENRDEIDPSFDEITEGTEEDEKHKLKTRWSQLEAMVGTEARLAQIAQDIVTHFEQRQEALDGKAMIVAMSRRIAVDFYDAIVALRPEWHDDTDTGGEIKVVMTASASDPARFQPHSRNKARRKALADRFKDPDDPLKLVIVRDMWLTGFDAPIMHTLYVDKPMRGHSLMQAIARVNRVFKDKPGGLIVDYLGIATDLQQAVQTYTDEGGKGFPAEDLDEVIGVMEDTLSALRGMFHNFDYSVFFDGTSAERVSLIPNAMNYVLEQRNGKKRFIDTTNKLSQAYALAVTSPEALDIREEVAFFQAVRAGFSKHTVAEGVGTVEEMDSAIKQLVSGAVAADNVIDIFSAAGLSRPDVSILSDEFLEEVQHLPQRNLALELLRKLINDEIKSRAGQNVTQSRAFSEMLEDTIRRYQNRTIDAAEVISELIGMAKTIRDAAHQGEELGLNPEEYAFYSALADNESAVGVMGDTQLAAIALELVQKMRQSVTLDWTVKESARAQIRVLVKRILKKYGYPPDLSERAIKQVMEQAEMFAAQWVS
jgi:type I restriction enzyme, R subunit